MKKFVAILLPILFIIESKGQTSEAYFKAGGDKYLVGNFKEAIENYTEAIRLNPNFVLAFFNRGAAKSKIKDNKGAIADYSKTIQLDSLFANAYYNRGVEKIAC